MRAVVQRVKRASVSVSGKVCGHVESGLLIYLGIDHDDGDEDFDYILDKVSHLRIFVDDSDRLNLDVRQTGGEVLVVSAFTVCADARKGRRPSFESAAKSDYAQEMYERFCDALANCGIGVARGSFGDFMQVEAINDGPICILLDSRKKF